MSKTPPEAQRPLIRLPLAVTPAEAEAIDKWRFRNEVPNRTLAIRRLIAAGLEATAQPAKAAP